MVQNKPEVPSASGLGEKEHSAGTVCSESMYMAQQKMKGRKRAAMGSNKPALHLLGNMLENTLQRGQT